MKPEYHEGPKVAKKFERLLTQLFRVPKSTAKATSKPVRKPKKASKG